MTSLSATLSTLQPVTCVTSLEQSRLRWHTLEHRGLCGDAHDLASCPAVYTGADYPKLRICS